LKIQLNYLHLLRYKQHKFFWVDYQFTQAGAAGYQNLYSNVNGLQDAWINYWKSSSQSI